MAIAIGRGIIHHAGTSSRKARTMTHDETLDTLYVDRSGGLWDGWIDTEEGKRRYQFYELRDAYRWATQHGYRVIALTY
jgi:hypothetical protein